MANEMSDRASKNPSFAVVCCFCAEPIAHTRHEPIELAVYFRDESTQGLCAHIDCLGARLHPSMPFLSLNDRVDCE
jgi:hypothetical protein